MDETIGNILFYVRIAIEIIVAFGVVVLIHELGHFLCAKMVGVGATDFALGMGPEIWGTQWGETRIKLCLFPIGGYVKLIGEEDEDVAPELQHKSLRSKKTWQKIAVIFAGPFMNFVLAIGMFITVVLIWGQPRTLPINFDEFMTYSVNNSTVIATFVDPRKPAGRAGVKRDDTILAVNGHDVKNIADFNDLMQADDGETVKLTVLRDFKEHTIEFKPKKISVKQKGAWRIGVELSHNSPPSFRSVLPGSIAERAGLKAGDVIRTIDGKNIKDDSALVENIQKGEGKAVTLGVQRGASVVDIKVTPEYDDSKMVTQWDHGIMPDLPTPRQVKSVAQGSPAALAGIKADDLIIDFDKQEFAKENEYKAHGATTHLVLYRPGSAPKPVTLSTTAGDDIGVALYPVNQHVGIFKAVSIGAQNSTGIFLGFFTGIKMLIDREVSTDEIAGPVGIIHYATTFARSGLMEFIRFFAAISIFLGVINLVPFPALDGSHIVFFLWEGITRRPLNAKRQGIINYVGFSILIALLIFVTFRDVRMWLGF